MKIGDRGKAGLALVILFCYPLLLMPYIVHTNIKDCGIVKESKVIPLDSLPEDIQDVIAFKPNCAVLLVEQSVSRIRAAIITDKLQKPGTVIEVTDKIIDWYVDWHEYRFFDRSFKVLIVGQVQPLGPLESFVETILSLRFGSAIFSLSKMVFFVGPLLLIVYLTLFFKHRFYLWNVPAVISLYSLGIFMGNMVGGAHQMVISDYWRYFGYLFMPLIPLTFLFSKYEESEEGGRQIRRYWNKMLETIDRLFHPK